LRTQPPLVGVTYSWSRGRWALAPHLAVIVGASVSSLVWCTDCNHFFRSHVTTTVAHRHAHTFVVTVGSFTYNRSSHLTSYHSLPWLACPISGCVHPRSYGRLRAQATPGLLPVRSLMVANDRAPHSSSHFTRSWLGRAISSLFEEATEKLLILSL